jgi:hypothetical protein
MPIGLFLGAGCPLSIKIETNGTSSPLIPGISGLTKQVCDKCKCDENYKKSFAILLSHFEKDGRQNPTIEDILSHLRALHQVAGSETVRGLTASELRTLDQMICNEISNLMTRTLPDYKTPYHKIASWIGAIPRGSAIQIFTTNYDLLMEQALEDSRVPFFDGFIGSFHTFFDSHAMEDDILPNRWVRLWKLHGSINWHLDDRGNVSRGEIEIEDSLQRRLIHPSHLKYDESRMMPYLAMIDRLRAFFKQPSCILITNGYSFSDQHINQIMIEGLKGNPTASIFAMLYGNLNKYPQAIGLSLGRSNLSLLAQNEAIIGTRRALWMETKETEPNGLPYAVDWIMKSGVNDIKQAQLNLGDFANFGNFLADIVGGEERLGR